MSADKHPAEVLAGWHDSMPYVPNSFGRKTAEMLRSIPAMEAERDQLRAEVKALRADAERLDWLAEPANTIGNVQLPRECVEQNLHSLRDAIDAARKQQ